MTKVSKEEKNPFLEFNVLKGEFITPEDEQVEDDIITGDETIIEEETPEEPVIDIEKQKLIDAEFDRQAKIKSGEVVETEEIDESTEDEETNIFKVFSKSLYDKGVIDVNPEEVEIKTEEDLEESLNKTVQNRIDKWVEALPDEYSKFLGFVQNGGAPKDFLDIYYGNHSWEGFEIESEANQKAVISESLRIADYTEEEINDMITEWTDNGSLEKRAKSALPKVQKHETSQKEAIIKIQEERAKAAKKADEDYWNDFKKDLFSRDEVLGFKLTPKVKEKLWNTMTVVDKRTGKTAYQEAVENKKDATILFALQAMNNFDVSKLETQVKTKVTSGIADILRNTKKTTKEKISSGRTDENFSTDDFKGFRDLKN